MPRRVPGGCGGCATEPAVRLKHAPIPCLTDGILTGGGHNAQCKILTSAPRKPVAENLAEHLADVADVTQRRHPTCASAAMKSNSNEHLHIEQCATTHEQSTFAHPPSQHTSVTHDTDSTIVHGTTHSSIHRCNHLSYPI